MQSYTNRLIMVTAILGILSGLLNLVSIIHFISPTNDLKLAYIIRMTTTLGAFLCLSFWMIGATVWQKSRMKKTGFAGCIASILGLMVIGYWYYISDFIHMEQTFALWNSLAIPLYIWGLLMFGTAALHTRQFPSLAIVLLTGGLIIGSSGLGYLWPVGFLMVPTGILWCSVYYLWKHTKNKMLAACDNEPKNNNHRLSALDIHRGLIMIVMAIDHTSVLVRKVHPFEFWNIPITDYSGDGLAFFTRFVTHFCAPGFFFLMGTGIILFAHSRMKNNWTKGNVLLSLVLRGALIIILEKIFFNPIIYGSVALTKFGVLFGLGGAMIVCALFVGFNRLVLLGSGLAVVIISQVFPQFTMQAGIFGGPFATMLLTPILGGTWVNLYPVLPWVGITLLGMGFGKDILADKEKAFTKILAAGLLCLLLFVVARWAGGFGNFQKTAGSGLIHFVNVVKYPPSLVFTLLTLGVNGIVLYLIEKLSHLTGAIKEPLLVFGKTALYFYFAHWFLYSGLGALFAHIQSNFLWMYTVWALGIVLLFPVCKRYLAFKQQLKVRSIWRFI
jgi:uncharacterized membrane protein